MVIKRLLYRWPLAAVLAVCLTAVVGMSCSHLGQQAQIVSEAERIADVYPDSALALLAAVDPAALTHDSIKAKYYYVLASAHDRQSHVALADSMVSFSSDYYRGKDLKRSIRSATLLASYKFRIGERGTALRMLDSLIQLRDVPDSLLIEPLRNRVQLWAYDDDNEARIRHLLTIDRFGENEIQYKFWLYFSLLFNGKNDSALAVIDELIDQTAHNGNSEDHFIYKYEKIGALMENARYGECIELADSLINLKIDDTATPYFHLWKSLGLINMQKISEAATELELADRLAASLPDDEQRYLNSFAIVLHTVLDYSKTGKVSFIPFSKINNLQRDYLQEEHVMRQEAARRALEIENQRLSIKAKSDRQTGLLIIIVLGALLVSGALIWYALNKKRKALEVLERNEILQKLVDESKSTQADTSESETLRRAMLQQLGIIKMVAETPTEQNRDMLRKISLVENGTDGSLVNWQNVYDMIDNLYYGFYSRLHNRHGNVLIEKEEQIIALMVAGFSTKEISVITGQTAATIYVRKSSVRKKLGVPEKEDIIAFLRNETDD